MKNSLTEESLRDLSGKFQQANNRLAEIYPGESGRRQPVHTVYGGAHLSNQTPPDDWTRWRAGRFCELQ